MRAGMLALMMAAQVFGQSANTVEGTVADKFTAAPVTGVSVELRRVNSATLSMSPTVYSTTSDEQGRFRFEAVPDGDYVPYYVKNGFLAHLSSATPSTDRWLTEDSITMPVFEVGSGKADVKLNARIEPIAELSGRVVDQDGRPVARMSVFAITTNGRMILGGRETDTEGRFKFSAPTGSYYLFATRTKLD
jgi:protocatechuate 3,4-dioxygenase beta subunit